MLPGLAEAPGSCASWCVVECAAMVRRADRRGGRVFGPTASDTHPCSAAARAGSRERGRDRSVKEGLSGAAAGARREEKVTASNRYDRSIVEGPLGAAVWKLAWPTMLTNIFGGLQGMVDHIMVGHVVGFEANAAIGVSMQVYIVVIVFITSLFTGMGVLVARFAGADAPERIDRTVYQAFLTATGIGLLILAPVGYLASPWLLALVNAAPEVQAEALPYLRVMFVSSVGFLIYMMLAGALRAAGDARTPMVLGITMTVLNVVFNVILIRGAGPIPALGTTGAALGSAIASTLIALYGIGRLRGGGWVVSFPRGHGWGPDWGIID